MDLTLLVDKFMITIILNFVEITTYCLVHVLESLQFSDFSNENGRFSFDPNAKLGLDIASCILTR